MSRAHLHGIKKRAERLAQASSRTGSRHDRRLE
jgi:hypothetical protein